MTPGAHLWTIVSKESRALLPTWIASATAACVAAMTAGDVHRFSVFAFVGAMSGLGAQSIGHEYGHRTLALMLTLPISRRRLFVIKLGVLGTMVLPLAAYAWWLRLFAFQPVLLWMLVASTLCLAPALTMLCRSQLAGMVFGLSLPPTILVAVIAGRTGSWNAAAALGTWSWLMIPVLAGGFVAGWLVFMRLESMDEGAAAIHMTSWTRARRIAPTHPLLQLVKKELRLQQMPFVITALYLMACAIAEVFQVPRPDPQVSFIGAVTVIYELGLSVVVGSLATAEERHLGTLAWQLQLPTPQWQQWAVKIGTVFSVSLLLSFVVPVVLVPAIWPAERSLVEMPVVLAIVMTAVSMYVSSLSATAIRAVVTSVVTLSFVLWLVLAPTLWTGRERGSIVLLSLVVLLMVWFAFVNHRPEQPGAARIVRQALSLAALVGFGVAVLQQARF